MEDQIRDISDSITKEIEMATVEVISGVVSGVVNVSTRTYARTGLASRSKLRDEESILPAPQAIDAMRFFTARASLHRRERASMAFISFMRQIRQSLRFKRELKAQNLKSFEIMLTVKPHQQLVRCVQFSPNGEYLATCG